MAYTNILRFMHLGLKSLDTVFNFYIILLLCVKLVFRAKLCLFLYPSSVFFIQAEFIILFSTASKYLGFWCKNKIKENKAHIFLTESYLMLQVQTIDG